MPPSLLLLALAMQASEPEPITVIGRPWAPFISPMGEPFRARSDHDDPLENWFRGADRDGDGHLTPAEMTADADRFFGELDSDGNGMILPDEFVSYEWELAPEIQVNSRWRRARGEPAPKERESGRRDRIAAYDPGRLQGAARYGLLNIPQPVAAADSNFDRAVTLEEFRQAVAYRFRLLDHQSDGFLTLGGLQALRVDPREARRRIRPKDGRDTRIATPLPKDD